MQKWFVLIPLLILPLFNASAETPEEKGLQLVQEADRRDTGWSDQKADMAMILRNRQGQESLRDIRIRTLEVADDGDKSLSIFDNPRDIKGTAFLSYTHALKPDDQWLFLPALKRTKRIASANKSGPFMGSEFAYEDLTSQEIAKYNYKYLRDETIENRTTWVIETLPQYENSGYTLRIVWMDQATYQPLKIEFYDRKKALLKTLTYHDYQQYLEQFWRADRMEMVNHQTGKETTLRWENYGFGNGYTERDFSRNVLKQAR